MSTYIKFCGMRDLADIQFARELGVHAIGLVLVADSPRAITLPDAATLRQQIPMEMEVFALVMDPSADFVRQVIHDVSPHYVQFHGAETAAFCNQFDWAYVKALSLQDEDLDLQMQAHASADGFIFDSHSQGGPGGTGIAGDWSRYPRKPERFNLLAGGLNPSNVAEAIRKTGCMGVDVSSGIESGPGQKSFNRMRDFVVRVQDAQVR